MDLSRRNHIKVIERNLGQRIKIPATFISAPIYTEDWRTGNKVTTPVGYRRFSSFFQVSRIARRISVAL